MLKLRSNKPVLIQPGGKISDAKVKISLIADVTPMPHDGPRPKKKRRV